MANLPIKKQHASRICRVCSALSTTANARQPQAARTRRAAPPCCLAATPSTPVQQGFLPPPLPAPPTTSCLGVQRAAQALASAICPSLLEFGEVGLVESSQPLAHLLRTQAGPADA